MFFRSRDKATRFFSSFSAIVRTSLLQFQRMSFESKSFQNCSIRNIVQGERAFQPLWKSILHHFLLIFLKGVLIIDTIKNFHRFFNARNGNKGMVVTWNNWIWLCRRVKCRWNRRYHWSCVWSIFCSSLVSGSIEICICFYKFCIVFALQ